MVWGTRAHSMVKGVDHGVLPRVQAERGPGDNGALDEPRVDVSDRELQWTRRSMLFKVLERGGSGATFYLENLGLHYWYQLGYFTRFFL
mmetsp:Transcript_3283/g.7598  ORF Transcript_3283/g.7598 Transcript_3283/m.7598 type:complete len:89 (+) Transcript_3283:357-623(+)